MIVSEFELHHYFVFLLLWKCKGSHGWSKNTARWHLLPILLLFSLLGRVLLLVYLPNFLALHRLFNLKMLCQLSKYFPNIFRCIGGLNRLVFWKDSLLEAAHLLLVPWCPRHLSPNIIVWSFSIIWGILPYLFPVLCPKPFLYVYYPYLMEYSLQQTPEIAQGRYSFLGGTLHVFMVAECEISFYFWLLSYFIYFYF